MIGAGSSGLTLGAAGLAVGAAAAAALPRAMARISEVDGFPPAAGFAAGAGLAAGAADMGRCGFAGSPFSREQRPGCLRCSAYLRQQQA